MPGYFSFDTETDIQYQEYQIPLPGKLNKGKFKTVRESTTFGPSWKDPNNDIYSIIYGTNPDHIKMIHNKKGFKRKLPYRVGKKLLECHTMIGTNLKFDLGYIWHDKYFQKWLINGGELWDCQLVAYLLSGQRWLYPALGEMERYYLGKKTKLDSVSKLFKRCISAKEIINRRNERKGWWKAYTHYGDGDGRSPMLIFQKQYTEAKRKGMLPIIKVYNRYLLALTMLEVNGLPTDRLAVEKLYQEYSLEMVKYLELASQHVAHLWNDPRLPAFNVNSPAHSSALLFGGQIKVKTRMADGFFKPKAIMESYTTPKGVVRRRKIGYEPAVEKFKNIEEYVRIDGFGLSTNHTSPTKTEGVYQVGEDVIEHIYTHSKNHDAHKYCQLLKKSKAYKQKISTYLNAMLNLSVDGIVRPNFNNCATATSRLSSNQPNAQNFPSHGEFGDAIQSLLIAPENWTCCNIDYSQLETFCRALLTKDPDLIRDLNNGIDSHVQKMAWGSGITYPKITYEQGYQYALIEENKKWKDIRSDSKAITFGEAYGQMPASMATRTGWPIEVVQSIYDKMYETYPGLVEFEKEVNIQVEQSAIISQRDGLSNKQSSETTDKKGVPTRFLGNAELLPIRERDRKSYTFDQFEYRHVGFYVSPTGKRYAFKEYGSRKQDGTIFRYFKPTQQKNYGMQGLAGDCQAITTAEMFQFLLRNTDKVKLVNEVHDSKWFIIKTEYLSCIVPRLCAIMEHTSQLLHREFSIPILFNFKVDVKTGPNFANMEKYNYDSIDYDVYSNHLDPDMGFNHLVRKNKETSQAT